VTDTYIYPATSNRLSSITLGAGGSRGLTYDAAGNVTGDNRNGQNFTYVYDAAGRMASVSLGGVL
jgi:YD repeat-containing protein